MTVCYGSPSSDTRQSHRDIKEARGKYGAVRNKRSGGGSPSWWAQCRTLGAFRGGPKTSSDVRAHEMNARNVGMFLFHCLPDKPVVRLSPYPLHSIRPHDFAAAVVGRIWECKPKRRLMM